MVQGKLVNKQGVLTLIDSGASVSVISQGIINKSQYLQSIESTRCRPIKIMVAGGNILETDAKIRFKVTIQNHIFEVNAYILPMLGGVDLVIGTKELANIDADLNFKRNTLKWKSKSIMAKTLKDVTLLPGQTRSLVITAKLPVCLRNAEVYLQLSKFMQSIAPSLCLVSMKKNHCTITVKNTTDRKIIVKSNKPIGTILLKKFGQLAEKASLKVETVNEYTARLMCEVESDVNNLHSIVASSQSKKGTGAYYPAPKLPPFCKGNKNIPIHLSRAERALYCKKSVLYPYLNCDDPRLWTEDEAILRKSIDLSKSSLTKKTSEKLMDMMCENINAYSLHDDIGEVKNMSIKIELNDTKPFFNRPYSCTQAEKQIIDRELQKLVLLGVLKRGMSSYSCPVFLLRKPHDKSGSYRVLGDFRTLNSRINSLHCAAPLLRDALPIIGESEATIFSSLDIKSAFYSIPLDKQSQKYVNICNYPGGQNYNYLRCPQGCNISPAEYNNVMSQIMDDVKSHNVNVLYIADDILIFSKDERSHLQHINHVLQALAKHGLKVAPGKCEYFKSSIAYMGHVISSENGIPTIRAQQSKIDAINALPTPINAKTTKSWVGMVSYLSSYVNHIQVLLQPIHKNTRKNCRFDWTQECDDNFHKINEIIRSNKVLSLPNAIGLMKLYVDSSIKGVGSCLMQCQNGQDRVLAFYSKKMPESAARWGITELEYMGISMAIHAFRYLLRGKHFEVYTDHNPIVQISVAKHEIPSTRLRKTYLKLSDYSFKLHYLKGVNMHVADYLSRNPNNETNTEDAIAFPMLTPMMKCDTCHNYIHDNWQFDNHCQRCVNDTYNTNNEQTITKSSLNVQNNNNEQQQTLYIATRSAIAAGTSTLVEGLKDVVRPRRSAASTPAAAARAPTQAAGQAAQGGTVTQSLPYVQPRAAIPLIPIPGVPPGAVGGLITAEIGQNETVGVRETLIKPEQIDPRRENIIPSTFVPNITPSMTRTTPLVYPQQPETSVRKPEDEYFVKPRDLFNPNIPIDAWFYKAVPKGSDLQKMLTTLHSRYITNTHLPISNQLMAQEQKEDKEFGQMYAYIKSDILPHKRSQINKVISQSENYAMADDILFRLDKTIDHATGESILQNRVCIPEKFVPYLLHIYHDSLLSSHMGIEKTYECLRQKFYIKRLTQRVGDWIRSCQVCQTIKKDQSEPRLMEGRFPTSYNPFQEISLDVKYMPPGVNGNNFLLVGCCNMTRYLIATPLKRADAIYLAEAIVDIIFTYGPPKVIYLDMDKAFTNQLTNYIYNALGIKRTIISPFAHQSFLVERHIGTIARFITSHLTGNGRQWPLYVKSSLFAYNTSPIKGIKVSPYELVYGRKPPMLDNLKFGPLEDIKTTYRDYAMWLKSRIQNISKYMEKLHTEKQLEAVAEDSKRVQTTAKYIKGSLVYMIAPQLGHLVTSSRKICAQYIGPLVVSAVVSAEKVTLEDIFGRKIHGVHSFDRLKQGYIRIENGKASTIDELKRALNITEFNKISTNVDLLNTESVLSMFSIPKGKRESSESESKVLLPSLNKNSPSTHIYYPSEYLQEEEGECVNFNKFIPHLEANEGLAFRVKLPVYKKNKIHAQNKKMPQINAELNISKAKYSNGILNVLLSTPIAQTRDKYSFWYPIESNSDINKNLKSRCSKTKVRISGSSLRFEDDISKIHWKPMSASGMLTNMVATEETVNDTCNCEET